MSLEFNYKFRTARDAPSYLEGIFLHLENRTREVKCYKPSQGNYKHHICATLDAIIYILGDVRDFYVHILNGNTLLQVFHMLCPEVTRLAKNNTSDEECGSMGSVQKYCMFNLKGIYDLNITRGF